MTKIQKFLTTSTAAVGALVTAPLSVLAQDATNSINLALPGSSQFNSVSSWTPTALIRAGINLILILAGLVAFLFLLWGGLQWILAGGDKEGTEKARKRITAALVGLVIVFAAYAIIQLVSSFLGVPLLQLNFVNISTAGTT